VELSIKFPICLYATHKANLIHTIAFGVGVKEEERRLRVFENRVLRKIFGPKWDEVTEEWQIQHNEELNYLYCSPSVARMIKSRMRWAGACNTYGEKRGTYKVWWGNLMERAHLEDPSIEGRIILG
jgi:hypothetical protein